MRMRMRHMVLVATAGGAVLAETSVWSQTTRPFGFLRRHSNYSYEQQPPRSSGDPIDLSGADDSPFTIPAVVVPPRLLASKPLATEYDVLTQRSIFRKGVQTIARPEENRASVAPTTAPAQQENYVFNGVARANDKLVAFFEDANSHAVLLRRDGDALAQGKIEHITLNGLDYVAGGRTTHLAIGQDLNGVDESTSLQSQPTGALSDPNGPEPADESVLDRLRRRRLKELGH